MIPHRHADHIGRELDAALAFLADFGPELGNGMTSHAPMVAEALDALGRPDAIAATLDRVRPLLLPWPPTTRPIDDWRLALGDWQRVSDWRAFFMAELAAGDWRRTLARWVPRLAAGASAHALHGLIRTAHAARSRARGAGAVRRDELAAALAAWAAAHAVLPVVTDDGARHGASASTSADAVLARLALLPAVRRRHGGSIVDALAQLSANDEFARAFDWPVLDGSPACARRLGALFARVFLANVETPLDAVVFTHGVTGSAAALHLLAYLAPDDASLLLRHVWHAGAALHVVYGRRPPAAPPEKGVPFAGLVDRAVAGGDEHAIKLAEAVLALELAPALAGATLERALRHL